MGHETKAKKNGFNGKKYPQWINLLPEKFKPITVEIEKKRGKLKNALHTLKRGAKEVSPKNRVLFKKALRTAEKLFDKEIRDVGGQEDAFRAFVEKNRVKRNGKTVIRAK